MEPKTKEQKKVYAMSRKLRPLSKHEQDCLIRKTFIPEMFVGNKKWWCSECGGWSADMSPVKKELDRRHKQSGTPKGLNYIMVTCPHCGARLSTIRVHLTYSPYVANEQRNEAVATTCDGYQVFRFVEVNRKSKRNELPVLSCNEVAQLWVSPTGKQTYLALAKKGNLSGCSYYDYESSMEVRKVVNSYSYYGWRYPFQQNRLDMHVTGISPTLKKRGFKGDFMGYQVDTFMTLIFNNSLFETLLKQDNNAILRKMSAGALDKYEKQIRICLRHKYVIEDFGLWEDMIRALVELGKDVHSPHYICPPDLDEAHDRWAEALRRKHERERIEKQRQEALKWEQEYAYQKKKFIGICFGNENVRIHVLGSVSEISEEGAHMHHCVFSMGYYKRPESLILSARDNDGNRIETVEVNLKNFTIAQSRGVQNTMTDMHQTIVDIVNENMEYIRKAAKAQKKFMKLNPRESVSA